MGSAADTYVSGHNYKKLLLKFINAINLGRLFIRFCVMLIISIKMNAFHISNREFANFHKNPKNVKL